MLHALSSRDLTAYMSRISWPKKLKENPLPCSKSYLDPYLSHNGHILDSRAELNAKSRKKKQTLFAKQYLGSGSGIMHDGSQGQASMTRKYKGWM